MENYISKILIVFFLLFCLSANAQLDSTRIKTFDDQLQIGLFLSDNDATANFYSTNNNHYVNQVYVIKPTLGVQFAYNGAIIALGTGIPIPSLQFNTEDYKITDEININGYFSRPKYILWGAIRQFEGADYNQLGLLHYNNANFLNLAGSFMYIFNENKYSFRAAYRQADQQLKSGGSFLAKGILNHMSLGDSTLFSLGSEGFRGLTANGGSLLGGYGYTLNFTENLFISALILGGVDIQRVSGTTEPILTERSPSFTSFAPTYDFKSSIGYNTDKFYISMLFSVDNRLSIRNINDEIDFDYNFLKIDLRFGTRIDAPKILTKVPFLN
ncbi:MAG: DUF4421 family protein [Saprospiraceae bacterium]